MRLVGLFATSLLVISGCAPTEVSGPPGSESTRRCVSSVSMRLIAFEPGRVYVRSRTGQALELTGEDACLSHTGNGVINVRPGLVGPNTGNICVGEGARLEIAAPAIGRRTCNVQVARIVPESEIQALPSRRSP